MTFIGIDLAWRGDNRPSGAVALRGDYLGAESVEVAKPLRGDEVLAYVGSSKH